MKSLQVGLTRRMLTRRILEKSAVRLVMATLVASASIGAAWQNEGANAATLDAQGNIYVVSRDGKPIRMGSSDHCGETSVAEDRQTVGCLVAVKRMSPTVDGFTPSVQLEIYLKGGEMRVIAPDAPILDWHFWQGGEQVAVYSGAIHSGNRRYVLYESATARVLEELPAPKDETFLPQWAKSRGQIDDEAVPMSTALSQERTAWIVKTLRQIQKIEPGMRRKDLGPVFTTEGGLYSRLQRTYVFAECPNIKVNIRFRAEGDPSSALTENPEDIIETISQPYLAFSTMD